jgi:hypothetical protein
MAEYPFKIAHIEGEQNVWADLVSRWWCKDAYRSTL